MDALAIIPFPGNPTEDDYEDGVPDIPYPYVFGLGNVPNKVETLADGKSKVFRVAVSEYVRDSVKTFTVQCLFDGGRPRWANTPSPIVNSTVFFMGRCHSMHPGGILRVDVEHICFNVGPQTVLPSPSTNTTDTSSPGKKRRRFPTVVSSAESSQTAASSGNDTSSSPIANHSQDNSHHCLSRPTSPLERNPAITPSLTPVVPLLEPIAPSDDVQQNNSVDVLPSIVIDEDDATGTSKSRGKRKAKLVF